MVNTRSAIRWFTSPPTAKSSANSRNANCHPRWPPVRFHSTVFSGARACPSGVPCASGCFRHRRRRHPHPCRPARPRRRQSGRLRPPLNRNPRRRSNPSNPRSRRRHHLLRGSLLQPCPATLEPSHPPPPNRPPQSGKSSRCGPKSRPLPEWRSRLSPPGHHHPRKSALFCRSREKKSSPHHQPSDSRRTRRLHLLRRRRPPALCQRPRPRSCWLRPRRAVGAEARVSW